MTALVSKSFIGTNALVPLVFGLLIYAIMGRLLGSSAIGSLKPLLSVATLHALVERFGFSPFSVSKGGTSSVTASMLCGEIFTAKLNTFLAATADSPIFFADANRDSTIHLLSSIFEALNSHYKFRMAAAECQTQALLAVPTYEDYLSETISELTRYDEVCI